MRAGRCHSHSPNGNGTVLTAFGYSKPAMFALLLLAAAHAGTLQLPPGEDVEAWRAMAETAGVTLVVEHPDLLLTHEGDAWALVRPTEPTANFPLPAPTTHEGRAAVLWLAARLITQGGPLPNVIDLEPPAPEYLVPAEVVAAAAADERLTRAELREQDRLAGHERYATAGALPAQPSQPRPAPLGWVVGLGLQAGVSAEAMPRMGVSVSGGARIRRDFSLGLLVEAGVPATTRFVDASIERDAIRATLGWRSFVVSAGLGRAEIMAGGQLHGELLFPVAALEYEAPFPAGPLWLIARPGAYFAATNIELESANGWQQLSPFAIGFSLTAERVLANFP